MDLNLIIRIFLFSFSFLGISLANDGTEVEEEFGKETTKVLSRKRRYLVFPDGSSFQLVFCTQNHGYLQVGDVVWFGNTAALAWELPTDPNIYHFFINSEKKFLEGNRRQDTKHVIYFDDDGKVLAKVPYRRKFIVNPAFAKRSVDAASESNMKSFSKQALHEVHKNKSIIHELDEMSIQFHRTGRSSLYTKIEKVLEGLGWNGKQCLLQLLCESGKAKQEQGTFIQEIMKVTFTFPKSAKSLDAQEYDMAHSAKEECDKKYPECKDLSRILL